MEWRNLNFGEKLLRFLLPLSALFAFGALYLTSSCRSMLGIYGLGVVITMFIAVPDWPYFYRNPLSWHQPLGVDGLTTPTPRQATMPRLQLHMKMSPTNQIGTSSHEYFLTSHSIWGVRAETILPGSSAGCLNHPRLEVYMDIHFTMWASYHLLYPWYQKHMKIWWVREPWWCYWLLRITSWWRIGVDTILESRIESRMFLFPVLMIVAFMVSRAA